MGILEGCERAVQLEENGSLKAKKLRRQPVSLASGSAPTIPDLSFLRVHPNPPGPSFMGPTIPK